MNELPAAPAAQLNNNVAGGSSPALGSSLRKERGAIAAQVSLICRALEPSTDPRALNTIYQNETDMLLPTRPVTHVEVVSKSATNRGQNVALVRSSTSCVTTGSLSRPSSSNITVSLSMVPVSGSQTNIHLGRTRLLSRFLIVSNLSRERLTAWQLEELYQRTAHLIHLYSPPFSPRAHLSLYQLIYMAISMLPQYRKPLTLPAPPQGVMSTTDMSPPLTRCWHGQQCNNFLP